MPTLNGCCPSTPRNVNSQGRTNYFQSSVSRLHLNALHAVFSMSGNDMPSCSHSCRALALERAEAHMAITAACYTRQETLPALLLHYCPTFSLGCSAFLFPLKPRILELRRPSCYMEASYMKARVYSLHLTFGWEYTETPSFNTYLHTLTHTSKHLLYITFMDVLHHFESSDMKVSRSYR